MKNGFRLDKEVSKDDVNRILAVLKRWNLDATDKSAYELWLNHSIDLNSAWLPVPLDDLELVESVQQALHTKQKVWYC